MLYEVALTMAYVRYSMSVLVNASGSISVVGTVFHIAIVMCACVFFVWVFVWPGINIVPARTPLLLKALFLLS